jgi:TolA-binding protein
MDNNLITIVITLITALGSAGAWRYYEVKLKTKAVENQEGRKDETMFRDDLRARVKKLEDLLTESNERVIELTAEVNALRTEVQFLRQENDRLKHR